MTTLDQFHYAVVRGKPRTVAVFCSSQCPPLYPDVDPRCGCELARDGAAIVRVYNGSTTTPSSPAILAEGASE